MHKEMKPQNRLIFRQLRRHLLNWALKNSAEPNCRCQFGSAEFFKTQNSAAAAKFDRSRVYLSGKTEVKGQKSFPAVSRQATCRGSDPTVWSDELSVEAKGHFRSERWRNITICTCVWVSVSVSTRNLS